MSYHVTDPYFAGCLKTSSDAQKSLLLVIVPKQTHSVPAGTNSETISRGNSIQLCSGTHLPLLLPRLTHHLRHVLYLQPIPDGLKDPRNSVFYVCVLYFFILYQIISYIVKSYITYMTIVIKSATSWNVLSTVQIAGSNFEDETSQAAKRRTVSYSALLSSLIKLGWNFYPPSLLA